METSLYFTLLLTCAILLFDGLYLYAKRRMHPYIHPVLFFLLVSILGILSVYCEINQMPSLWAPGYFLLFFFLAFVPYAWYEVCSLWAVDSKNIPRYRTVISKSLLVASILFFICFIFLRGIDISLMNGRWLLNLNGWRFWYGAYFVIALASGVYAIETCYRSALGLSRERIKKSFFLLLAGGICFLADATVGFLYGQINDWILIFTFAMMAIIFFMLLGHYTNFSPASSGVILTRKGVYSSLSIVLLGLYFLIVGAIGELLMRFRLNESVFFTIVIVVLLSITFGLLLFLQMHRSRLKSLDSVSSPFAGSSLYGAEWKEFAEEISVSLDIRAICSRTSRLLHRLLKIEDCFFIIREPAPSENFIIYSEGNTDRGLKENEIRLLVEWLYRFGHPVEVTTLKEKGNAERDQLEKLLEKIPFDVPLLVPLAARQQFIGIWGIGGHTAGGEITSNEIAFIEAAASPLSLTILGARMTDELFMSREIESYHRFSSFVLHDLKNSVGMLSMLLKNAEKNMDNPDFQKEALLTIGKAVERQKKIISRLTAEKTGDTLSLGKWDIGRLVKEALERIRIDTMSTVRLTYDIPDGITVFVDSEKIGSVFDNLIMNAAEAMSTDGGEITIRQEPVDTGSYVAISITDTGAGMDEEFISTHLYKPFSSTKKHGLGIGMYQSREIIKQHQGRLEVTSRPGRGTTFTVYLPGEKRFERENR